MKREPAASSPPPLLPRLPRCLPSLFLLRPRLFIRGHPLLSPPPPPPPPLASLYSRFYLAALYPPTLHGHTTFFFSGFHLPASHFLAPRYKRPTNDRPVPPNRAMENIPLAGPIFNYYPPRRRTPASERGSGGNLGRVLTYTSSCVSLSQSNKRGGVFVRVVRTPSARQDFIHKFQNKHVF